MPGSLRLWTITEAAEAIGISRRTLQRWIKDKKAQVSPVGRIPNEEVLRLASKT